eukprot:10746548-Ditylum_brightwellii.AAC.1
MVRTDAPSQTGGSGTFSVASWNIHNDRNGGLESACRGLDLLGVDIGFLQETKLTRGIYTCFSSGYKIMVSDAPSAHQGGIALCWRVNGAYEIKEAKFLGPHVLSFQLRTGLDRYFVMGCYIPPDYLDALEHVKRVWEEQLKGCKPLLLGDLNINLEYPRDERDGIIAKQCNSMDLQCMSRDDGAGGRRGWGDGFH